MSEGTGIPERVYTLPRGHHPSGKKLKEADFWGIDLSPVAARFEGDRVIYVICNTDPEQARIFMTKARFYKDNGQPEEVKRLEEGLRDIVWADLDEPAKKSFGKKDRIIVLRQSIRDFSPNVDIATLLEQN